MFELSEKNLMLIVIALSAFLILLLAKRPAYNTCVRERLDTDYHTMFDKSNNILCPSDEGNILTKEEITNPKTEIENIAHDHDHEHEHEKVLNEEHVAEEEPTLKEIITSIADMEESTSNLLDDSQQVIKEEVKKISEEVKKISEEVAKIQSENKPVTEEVIKTVTEEVVKVSGEVKSVAEEVKKIQVEENVEATVPENNNILKNMVVKIAGEVKKVAGEVKKIKEESQVIDEEEQKQEEEKEQEDEAVTIKKVAEEIKKIMDNKVKSESSTEESKSVEIVNNIPAPYSGLMLGYSIGGIDNDNDLVTEVITKVNPRCDVYKDAVKKLNLSGYIKNDDLNQSWNDSFGNSCGKI